MTDFSKKFTLDRTKYKTFLLYRKIALNHQKKRNYRLYLFCSLLLNFTMVPLLYETNMRYMDLMD